MRSWPTLVGIALIVGTCILVDTGRSTTEPSSLNAMVPGIRKMCMFGKKLDEPRRRALAHTSRRSFLAKSLGLIVAGIMLNETTPSLWECVFVVIVYTGERHTVSSQVSGLFH